MSLTNSLASVTTIIRGLINDQSQLDGQDIFEYSTSAVFNLSEPFLDTSSIIVQQNGTDITSANWSYDSNTGQITILFTTSGDALVADDIILVTYDYYKKYSNTEIQGFLESSFSYFVQHRYRKTFEIDDNDNIVVIDDLDPTTNELYFISIISAILIDPQNINIKTDAFSLSAKRNVSDQAQISKAFAQFKRFVGTVDFEIPGP